MFYSYFERKNEQVLTFNIVHFPNFEISASLIIAANNNFNQNLISVGGAY